MSTPLFSRRLFLSRGVQLLSVASTLPTFLDHSARVLAASFAANPQGAGRPNRVLVVVQLAGGNDGLNTVIPWRNDDYYKARPRLGIAKKDALRLTDDLAVHPQATGLKKLYDEGLLSVIQGVGYPNPNRSHFRSTDIWQTAEPEAAAKQGWLGKYFDACCNGQDPGKAADSKAAGADPASAIALVAEPPQALMGQKYLPLVFRNPQNLTHNESANNAKLRTAFEKLNDGEDMSMNDADHQMAGKKPDETSEFLERSALNARVYADKIKKTASSVSNKVAYPTTGLASDLKLVAQMIAAGLPTRVYYVTLGGFDTHSNQISRHGILMQELGGALAAFNEDLKALGHVDRVTTMTFSEFGRRVNENGGAGTDHGEASPMFVMGGGIKAGIYGELPNLAAGKLHRGDLPYSTDFRRVYAGMLHDWLGADDVKILGKKFERLELFKNV